MTIASPTRSEEPETSPSASAIGSGFRPYHSESGITIYHGDIGSGSSVITAFQRGFSIVACEIDEFYFLSAIERIKIETNQTQLFSNS